MTPTPSRGELGVDLTPPWLALPSQQWRGDLQTWIKSPPPLKIPEIRILGHFSIARLHSTHSLFVVQSRVKVLSNLAEEHIANARRKRNFFQPRAKYWPHLCTALLPLVVGRLCTWPNWDNLLLLSCKFMQLGCIILDKLSSNLPRTASLPSINLFVYPGPRSLAGLSGRMVHYPRQNLSPGAGGLKSWTPSGNRIFVIWVENVRAK